MRNKITLLILPKSYYLSPYTNFSPPALIILKDPHNLYILFLSNLMLLVLSIKLITPLQTLNLKPPIGIKKTRHYEIHRERCDHPGCNGKICIGLCSNFKDRKAVAHGTHGKSLPHETDRVTVPGSQKDFNGDSKPQNYVFYKDAHDANPTPEHIQGTQQINNDPNIMQTIITHEDKK